LQICLLQKKEDGFEGQRAIVIPTKVLSRHCDAHAVVKQLYVTDIGYYPNAQYHHRQRIEAINQHILIYCVKGKGWAKILDKSYSITPGDFILLPAGCPHEYGAEEQDPWTIYWMHFKGTNSRGFIDMMLKKMGDHVAPIFLPGKQATSI
jgi:uncharacterized RmlC-like cupin family protein